MEPDKKVLMEIAHSYNTDMAVEKRHRNSMTTNLLWCAVWIAVAMAKIMWPTWFKDSEFMMIWFGCILIVLCILSTITIHYRYKTKMKHIMYARQACLILKDQIE
jgi:cbb3-type cytochrome oxidase subunit 3